MIVAKPETALDTGIDGECICAENPPFNAVTLAAMQEARDIASGKIPAIWYKTPEDMISALKKHNLSGTHSELY